MTMTHTQMIQQGQQNAKVPAQPDTRINTNLAVCPFMGVPTFHALYGTSIKALYKHLNALNLMMSLDDMRWVGVAQLNGIKDAIANNTAVAGTNYLLVRIPDECRYGFMCILRAALNKKLTPGMGKKERQAIMDFMVFAELAHMVKPGVPYDFERNSCRYVVDNGIDKIIAVNAHIHHCDVWLYGWNHRVAADGFDDKTIPFNIKSDFEVFRRDTNNGEVIHA